MLISAGEAALLYRIYTEFIFSRQKFDETAKRKELKILEKYPVWHVMLVSRL